MAMPTHAQMVSRVKELEKRLEALETVPRSTSMGVVAPAGPSERDLFIWSCLSTFIAGQFRDPHGAFLNPESRPEDTAVYAFTAMKRALAMFDGGDIAERLELAARQAQETHDRLHPAGV